MSRAYTVKKGEQPPLFACQHCGKRHQLTFHPRTDYEKWAAYKCPHCKKSRLL